MEILSMLLTNKLLQRHIIMPEKAEICKSGFMLIIADIINFSLILIIGVIIKSFFYSIIYLIIFWTVRRFSGGFHAKTYVVCRMTTVSIYIIICWISKVLNVNLLFYTTICDMATIVTMFIFAPIRHPNKELTEKELKANKLFSLLTTLLYTIISIMLVLIGRKEGLVISLILFSITILMYVGLITNGKEAKQNVKSNR